jgi:hypothetical protein
MANPTTNYGFVLPTSSDLVTDLPADFDVALQGVDTRLKALQPGTTLGDIAYSSATANTNTRLGIGSTGNVLTVAGGVPTWAAPGGAGANWSLLNAGGTALTGAATVTVSGISGADKIMVLVQGASSASAYSNIALRLNTDTGDNYNTYGVAGQNQAAYGNEATDGLSLPGEGKIRIGSLSGTAASSVHGTVLLTGCNSSGVKSFIVLGSGVKAGNADQVSNMAGGFYNSASTISSISINSNVGNLDAGTVFVYTSA